MGVTQDLVKFITNITYDELPRNVIEQAKIQILDCFGVTLAGSTHRFHNIIKNYLNTISGRKQSTVIGLGLKTSFPEAAKYLSAHGDMLLVIKGRAYKVFSP